MPANIAIQSPHRNTFKSFPTNGSKLTSSHNEKLFLYQWSDRNILKFKLRGNGKILLKEIVKRCSIDGIGFPSQKTLAKATACDVRTVKRWMVKYQDLNLLQYEEQGWLQTNKITLILDDKVSYTIGDKMSHKLDNLTISNHLQITTSYAEYENLLKTKSKIHPPYHDIPKKEVGNANAFRILEEKLRGIHSDVAETVREQAIKYMSKNKLTHPGGFFDHLINREQYKRYDSYTKDSDQQARFRRDARKREAATKARLDQDLPGSDKQAMKSIMAEIRRRLHEKI